MLAFVAGYTRPDGLAPQVGDADDGRFLPLGDYGRDPRDHRHLFAQAGREFAPTAASVDFPRSGFYVMRESSLYVIVRCGDTGRYGLGGHSHNDQLSFELANGAEPLIVDPGTFSYTPDPEARNLFRSTGFHSTLRIDVASRTSCGRTICSRCRTERKRKLSTGRARRSKVGTTGFRGRRIPDGSKSLATASAFATPSTRLRRGTIEWTFTLAPRAESKVEISGEGLEFRAEPGWYSPSYGVRVPTTFLRARRRSRPGDDVTEITVRAAS